MLEKHVDPDQMPCYIASDPGLHCLPMTLLQVSTTGTCRNGWCICAIR